MGVSDGRVIGALKLFDNGLDSQRWVLVIMSDGYTDLQMNKFAIDANSFVGELLATEPFAEYRQAINIYRIDVASDEEGADKPSCIATPPVKRRTYFDSTFCVNDTARLLAGDSALAINTASGLVRNFNAILVLVNSDEYGGSGGSFGPIVKPIYTSIKSVGGATWQQTAIHELGHAAFDLADEYDDLSVVHSGGEPYNVNLTTNTNLDTIKWGDLIRRPPGRWPTRRNPGCPDFDPVTDAPATPGTVGAFEGGDHASCGVYRPEADCKMRTVSVPFCKVCQLAGLRELGKFHFGKVGPFSSTWSTGWTSFVPFSVGGQPYYLSYKILTGEVAIDRVLPGLTGTETKFVDTWSSGWSHFVPFNRVGVPHYFSYNSITGAAAVDQIRADLSGVDTLLAQNWGPGYSLVAAFLQGGEPRFLIYNGLLGEVRIGRFKPDLSSFEDLFVDTWTLGWTSIMPIIFNSQTHLLSYKSTTGEVAIDRVRSDDSGVDNVFSAFWTTGWTSFTPFEVYGRAHYLVYKFATGETSVDRVRDDAWGADRIFTKALPAGLTSMMGFRDSGGACYLAYNAATGAIMLNPV